MIGRVFPRRTNATPRDALAFVGLPQDSLDGSRFDGITHFHVSVTFVEDKPVGERLAEAYDRIAPTTIGGPAYDYPGGEFDPGKYLEIGYLMTSRGCPRKCNRCFVPKREGALRELAIKDGWNILDNNILATSPEHFEAVCEMLGRQKHAAIFTGGLESRRLTAWHVERLARITPKPDRLYLAYDNPFDYEPLVIAGRLLHEAGFTYHHLYCYVLIGYTGDTLGDAEARCRQVWDAGFVPYAMLWSNGHNGHSRHWHDLQRAFTRPAITRARLEPKPEPTGVLL